jgi:hypothetical protein
VSGFLCEVDDDGDPANKLVDYAEECGPSKIIIDCISPSLSKPAVGMVLVFFLYT